MKIIPCRQKRESMEKLDKERYLKRVIIVCWIALAICFGIKLFGGNLFKIMCENENFIKVCEYADNHWWADFLISCVYGFTSTYFTVLAMCGVPKYKKWQLYVLIITIALGTVVKMYSNVFGLIFDVWQIILMPMLFSWQNKKRYIWVILGNIMIFVFQLLSALARNIGIKIITDDGILISAIFSIDVILMAILYYCYTIFYIKKGENHDGKIFRLASMRRRCRVEEDERTGKDRRGEESDR